jgi:D-alanyl-D-alanine carboxypeptidase (penicillin-binding protein 5/6)
MSLFLALHVAVFSLAAAPATPVAPAPGTTEYYAALPESYYCIEAASGAVLDESNADAQRPPASMIKMMLMLMVEEGIDAGRWNYDMPIVITKNAEGMGGTQVYVKTGDSHALGQLMPAVAVASANDAAMAVAEGLWGSKDAYIEAMN